MKTITSVGAKLQAMRRVKSHVCAQCGKEFTSLDPRAKFCGKPCKRRALYLRKKALYTNKQPEKTMKTAAEILAKAGYSDSAIMAGIEYADRHDPEDEDERGAYALAHILYDADELERTPKAGWEPCCYCYTSDSDEE